MEFVWSHCLQYVFQVEGITRKPVRVAATGRSFGSLHHAFPVTMVHAFATIVVGAISPTYGNAGGNGNGIGNGSDNGNGSGNSNSNGNDNNHGTGIWR